MSGWLAASPLETILQRLQTLDPLSKITARQPRTRGSGPWSGVAGDQFLLLINPRIMPTENLAGTAAFPEAGCLVGV